MWISSEHLQHVVYKSTYILYPVYDFWFPMTFFCHLSYPDRDDPNMHVFLQITLQSEYSLSLINYSYNRNSNNYFILLLLFNIFLPQKKVVLSTTTDITLSEKLANLSVIIDSIDLYDLIHL